MKSRKSNEEKRNSRTKINQSKAKEAVREINRGLKKASKVTPDAARRSQKALIRNVVASGRVSPDSPLMTWAKLLANPFGRPSGFCPVNYNPAPSFIQSLARTTSTNLSMNVALNTATQMVLFPGHFHPPTVAGSSSAGVDGMDAVSYHSEMMNFNGTSFVVGPMNETGASGAHTAAIGHYITGLASGQTYGSSVAVTGSALTWDVSLPYVHDSGSGHGAGAHTRWQLVAMGIRIRNITPELTRGGNVISVIPNNSMAMTSAPQATLEVYPTFHDWGVCDEAGAEVTWIPRAQDLAFWHTQSAVGALTSSNIRCPGIVLFFNAGATLQTYSYEIVCHWQLAGTYLNQIGGPAPHHPELKPTIEKTVGGLLNTQPTASAAPRVVEMAHSNDGASSSQFLMEKLGQLKDVAVHTAGVAAAGYAFGRRRALGPA